MRHRTCEESAPAWRISLLLQSPSFPRSSCAPAGPIKYAFSSVTWKQNLVKWQHEHTWNIFFSAPLCLMYSLGKNSFRLQKQLQQELKWMRKARLPVLSATLSKWWRCKWDVWLTLRIQVCVCALYEVQTGFAPGCLQTRRPYQKIQDGNHLRCHLVPARNEEKSIPSASASSDWALGERQNCREARLPPPRWTDPWVTPARKADWAGLDLWSPRSGQSRRTCAWGGGSRSRPRPALWRSCCDPASSLAEETTGSNNAVDEKRILKPSSGKK